MGSLSYRLRAAKFLPGRAVRFDEISSQTKRVRSELSTRQRSVPSHRARPRGVSSAPHEEGTDPARRSPAPPPSAGRTVPLRAHSPLSLGVLLNGLRWPHEAAASWARTPHTSQHSPGGSPPSMSSHASDRTYTRTSTPELPSPPSAGVVAVRGPWRGALSR